MLTQLFRAVSISWITRNVFYLALLIFVTCFISIRDSKRGSKNRPQSALAAFLWLSFIIFQSGLVYFLLQTTDPEHLHLFCDFVKLKLLTGDEVQTSPVCSAFVSALGLWLHPDQALTISWTLFVLCFMLHLLVYFCIIFCLFTAKKKEKWSKHVFSAAWLVQK